MRTGLGVLFIAAIGGTAAFVARRPTVVRGEVLAADVLEAVRDQGITEVRCDEEVPVTWHGATLACHVAAADGSTAVIRYQIDRGGGLSAKVVDGTRPHPARAPGADPWAD
jgi:hypothetical protein